MTAAHSDGMARRPSSFQLATMAARLIVRIPPASAIAGSVSVARPAGFASGCKSGCNAVSDMTCRFSRPGASRLCTPDGRSGAVGEVVVARERGEAGNRGVELHFHGSSRAVTLLSDDNFRLAVHFVGL